MVRSSHPHNQRNRNGLTSAFNDKKNLTKPLVEHHLYHPPPTQFADGDPCKLYMLHVPAILESHGFTPPTSHGVRVVCHQQARSPQRPWYSRCLNGDLRGDPATFLYMSSLIDGHSPSSSSCLLCLSLRFLRRNTALTHQSPWTTMGGSSSFTLVSLATSRRNLPEFIRANKV